MAHWILKPLGVGATAMLAGIVRLVQNAQATKLPVQKYLGYGDPYLCAHDFADCIGTNVFGLAGSGAGRAGVNVGDHSCRSVF